jgi:FtsP/CotA-like multicopper oxidase with cupredoxin domain
MAALAACFLLLFAAASPAAIEGIVNTGSPAVFDLSARAGHISTPDGNSILIWGYGANGQVQYPGPTLIVNQGATVQVRLINYLPEPVSIVFPGHLVTASGGTEGVLTREAPADGGATVVTYTFTAHEPGTYTYYSGSHPDLQVEMGLFGAIIVRPAGFDAVSNRTAYGDSRSAYEREFLFLLSEIDPRIHQAVEMGAPYDTTDFWPVYWFINGRAAPDTMAASFVPWLPTQPYGVMPMAAPGQRVLMRLIGGGRDQHPFHTHGNNFDLIARDGRLMQSAGDAFRKAEVGRVTDLAVSDFGQTVSPGATYDAIFVWTGKKLGWDIYGDAPHTCMDMDGNGFDDTTWEWCADHGKPLPVILPDTKDLTFGAFWSGSPFIGASGALPPGEGGFNPTGALVYMWHSHNEKEMTNFDIFPGGLMTMFMVEPPGMAGH